MTERDDRLQEHLEALDAGEPLDRVLASASDDDAGLLRLASSVRAIEHPAPARRAVHALNRRDTYARAWTGENENGPAHPLSPPARHARSQGLMSKLSALGLSAALIVVIVGAAILLPRLSDEPTVAGPEEPATPPASRTPAGPVGAALTLPHDGEPGWLETDTAYPPEHSAFSPDGRLLATAHKNGTAIIWDLTTGERQHTFQGEVERAGEQGIALTHEISDITFSPDGTLLAAARPYTPGIDVWDVATGEHVALLEGERGLRDVAFSPDGTRLAGAVDSGQNVEPAGQTIIWSTATWEVERTLDGAAPGIVFSPDGATLITRSGVSLVVWTGGEAGPVKLWDVATGELRATVPVDGFVMQMALTPDGETLAISALLNDADPATLLVDVATGDTRLTLPAADLNFDSLAFSPDGALLVTGYQPNRLVGWNTATGALVFDVTGPADWLRYPVFSPDGALLAVNSSDGRVLLWDVGTLGVAEQPTVEATEAAPPAPFVGWLWCGYNTAADDDAPNYKLPPGREDAVESERQGFWVAYPQSWEGLPGTCDRDRVAFISPETRTEVRVWVREGQGGPDWLENVKQRWGQIMAGLPPDDLSVVESNVRLQDRDALLACQPSHPGMGTVAALVFPDGNDLIAFYLYVGGDPTYWQAEADIFETMLASFSLGPEPSVSDFTFPDGAWCESYEPVNSLWGRVGTVAASDAVIVLAEPAKGFVTVSLAPGGELVDAAGQPIQWADIPPGAQIEAEGATGERGNYVAERIVVPITEATANPSDLPVEQPPDGLPADAADWVSYELPDTGVTVPVPPRWTVAEWPVDDTVPFAASVSIWPQWDRGETPPPGQPEISVTVWPRPAGQALREWLDAHTTAAPFDTDTGAEDEIIFFGVRNVAETTLGGQPALGFTHDVMGVQVLTIIAEGPGVVVGLSKTRTDQFPLGPVFNTMQALMHISPAR